MPKLKEQEHKMLYYFTNKSNRKMQKYSGDEISESDIKTFDVPDFLLEQPPKNPGEK